MKNNKANFLKHQNIKKQKKINQLKSEIEYLKYELNEARISINIAVGYKLHKTF
jgi:hypothetical protein